MSFTLYGQGLYIRSQLSKWRIQLDIQLGQRNGNINKITRTLSYRVKEFKMGDMFGHEEIFERCERRSTVTTVDE